MFRRESRRKRQNASNLAPVTLVAGHGNGAGQPRVEVASGRRIPTGVPRPTPPGHCTPTPPPAPPAGENADPTPDCPPGGLLGPGAPTAVLSAEQIFPRKKFPNFTKGNPYAAMGGAAKKDIPKLLSEANIPDSVPFRRLKAKATTFLKYHQRVLARDVGGGHCGPAPSMMVKFASFQAAAGEYLYAEAVRLLDEPGSIDKAQSLFESASKLSNASRQNLLAAHELCAKEALSRRNKQPGSEQSAFEKAFSK